MALLNKTNDDVNYNQQTHILISFFVLTSGSVNISFWMGYEY